LNEEEIRLLSIRKGSLNDKERREIESHVTHTYLFLSKIPWTTGLKEVPRIAYGHHEKLNGSGYPNNLGSEEIPIQTRMMTISDIYDALTASDRPYKKAVPTAKALDILASEVKSGQVDSELFQLFLDAKVYLMTSHI
jgi:HD-GYP domain-containing protein (c-di-GMP phosphodiesterase class II)